MDSFNREGEYGIAPAASWAAEHLEQPGAWVFAKRLSANDTQANDSHQAGPHFPKEVVFGAFPGEFSHGERNPKHSPHLYIDSHGLESEPVFTWYNNRLFDGTRSEARLTNLGGANSPLLNSETTGALVVFVFIDSSTVRCWLCRDVGEEESIGEFLGPLEPGESLIVRPDGSTKRRLGRTIVGQGATPDCPFSHDTLPPDWFVKFPSPAAIIEEAFRRMDSSSVLSADARLLARRTCETNLFYSIEELHEMPIIAKGYESLQSFVRHASSVLQRRKSRAGQSLERHVERVLEETGFRRGTDFQRQAVTEGKKTPDFIFPNAASYHNSLFPGDHLIMLAAKTTCKDRWRQILNEADRIPAKHLITLQEGVSEHQFAEMQAEAVTLVVPAALHSKYPASIRTHLVSLEGFIELARIKAAASS